MRKCTTHRRSEPHYWKNKRSDDRRFPPTGDATQGHTRFQPLHININDEQVYHAHKNQTRSDRRFLPTGDATQGHTRLQPYTLTLSEQVYHAHKIGPGPTGASRVLGMQPKVTPVFNLITPIIVCNHQSKHKKILIDDLYPFQHMDTNHQ